MKKIRILLLLSLLVSVNTFALYQDFVGAIHLTISLKNDTPYDCHLVDAEIYNGIDQSIYKPIIKSGDHAKITLMQLFHRIDHYISYSCNGKVIAFYNSRNRSIFWAGKASGRVVESQTDKGIFAEAVDVYRGSAFLVTHAHIAWSIHMAE